MTSRSNLSKYPATGSLLIERQYQVDNHFHCYLVAIHSFSIRFDHRRSSTLNFHLRLHPSTLAFTFELQGPKTRYPPLLSPFYNADFIDPTSIVPQTWRQNPQLPPGTHLLSYQRRKYAPNLPLHAIFLLLSSSNTLLTKQFAPLPAKRIHHAYLASSAEVPASGTI